MRTRQKHVRFRRLVVSLVSNNRTVHMNLVRLPSTGGLDEQSGVVTVVHRAQGVKPVEADDEQQNSGPHAELVAHTGSVESFAGRSVRLRVSPHGHRKQKGNDSRRSGGRHFLLKAANSSNTRQCNVGVHEAHQRQSSLTSRHISQLSPPTTPAPTVVIPTSPPAALGRSGNVAASWHGRTSVLGRCRFFRPGVPRRKRKSCCAPRWWRRWLLVLRTPESRRKASKRAVQLL